MRNFQGALRYFWCSILVAFGYISGLILTGLVASLLGIHLSMETSRGPSFTPNFIASMLLGIILVPFASQLQLKRKQHFALWGSLILFNLGSVIIEGAYFAPNLVPIPIPVLMVQQLLASAGAALVLAVLFACHGQAISWRKALQTRPWHSWIWRFIASATSYLVLYFVVGSLNYQFVTRPYYELHAGGLNVPAPDIILKIESVRSLLIVFSVFLFLLSIRGSKQRLMVSTGWMLFAIGGIVPLVWQMGTLPLPLVVASLVEIFFQNFSTGLVAALLLGISEKEPDISSQAEMAAIHSEQEHGVLGG
jgi:hypothetical protein